MLFHISRPSCCLGPHLLICVLPFFLSVRGSCLLWIILSASSCCLFLLSWCGLPGWQTPTLQSAQCCATAGPGKIQQSGQTSPVMKCLILPIIFCLFITCLNTVLLNEKQRKILTKRKISYLQYSNIIMLLNNFGSIAALVDILLPE